MANTVAQRAMMLSFGIWWDLNPSVEVRLCGLAQKASCCTAQRLGLALLWRCFVSCENSLGAVA